MISISTRTFASKLFTKNIFIYKNTKYKYMQKYSNINNWNKGKDKMKNNLLILLISRQIGIHCFKNKFLKKKKEKGKERKNFELVSSFRV